MNNKKKNKRLERVKRKKMKKMKDRKRAMNNKMKIKKTCEVINGFTMILK